MEREKSPEDSEQVEAIRRRAYELRQQAGRPEGQNREHWLEAERELGAAYRPRANLDS
jgi:hypothetical protein